MTKKTAHRKTTKGSLRTKDANRYPKGWNRKKVAAVLAHYENQTEDEAVAEDEAAYHSTLVTMMAIPVDLVPKVQKLLAKRAR
jgi:hypothetical protein